MTILTPAQISAVYTELGTLFVTLDPDPTRGLQYVRERLALCRAMRDRLGELTIQCSQGLSAAHRAAAALALEYHLAPTVTLERQVAEAAVVKQDHVLLLRTVTTHRSLLMRTSADIRLLVDLTRDQLKLGEINPTEAGIVQPMVMADIEPGPQARDGRVFEPAGGETNGEGSGILGDGGREEPPLNYEDLFGALQHGETSRG